MNRRIIMTFEAAFKKLKEKFANVDPKKLEDMAIQITISDEDCGGTFYAEVRNNVLAVEPYDYKDNDAVIDITKKALASILDGKSTFEKAVEKGEATVMGNIEKIASVKDAIAPAKKPAAKKATAKKAPVAKKAAVKDEKPATKKTTVKEEKPAAKKAPEAKVEKKETTATAAKTTKAAAPKKTTKK